MVHVVSTRATKAAPPFFTGERATGRSFARFDISIPPNRPVGQIQWRGDGPADPTQHFLTSAYAPLATKQAFATSLRRSTSGKPDALVFVHGFNTNFAEALYRLAQLTHDLRTPGQPVLFSWPSGGDPRGYLYDRDSALLARDALAQTLTDLDRATGGNVTVVAFSMGSFLVTETLRQMANSGGRGTLARLNGVVLVSPDIDVDLFRAQAEAIKPLPKPFAIMASEEDSMLSLSALLTGQPDRLGTLSSLDGMEDLGIALIDVTDFGEDAETSHTTALTSPSLLRILSAARGVDAVVQDELRRITPNRSRRAGPSWLRRVMATEDRN